MVIQGRMLRFANRLTTSAIQETTNGSRLAVFCLGVIT